MEWSPVEWIFTPSIDNFAEDARLEAAHGEPKDQTLDQSSGVTGKSIVAQNKELQDEVARLRWGLDGIKKMVVNNHGKVIHLAKTIGSSVRSLTGKHDRYRVVRDVRIRALEDASSGPVSLDGLSGHKEKHGEDSPTTSDGHMLTYDNLNASQSLTGDLGGVKPWLTATSNDTVQDQGSLTGNHEPTMPIQNATFEPESFRKTFAYLGWHERSRAYNSSVDNLMIGIALTRPSGP